MERERERERERETVEGNEVLIKQIAQVRKKSKSQTVKKSALPKSRNRKFVSTQFCS